MLATTKQVSFISKLLDERNLLASPKVADAAGGLLALALALALWIVRDFRDDRELRARADSSQLES